jgi:hypothetical protein
VRPLRRSRGRKNDRPQVLLLKGVTIMSMQYLEREIKYLGDRLKLLEDKVYHLTQVLQGLVKPLSGRWSEPCGDEWKCFKCGTCNAGKAAKCMGCGE